jgi:hypothetical protein
MWIAIGGAIALVGFGIFFVIGILMAVLEK